ncbi:MAG: argininosuccinate lyase [Rhodospirillaceae bacterium]|nr:argininosuccinate lyase [Rhodospirillaceae bacterium]
MTRKTSPAAPPAPEAGAANTPNRMWGGRFEASPDEVMEAINASIDFDRRLYAEDIAGSIAHVTMLAKQEIVSHEDADAIADGLRQVRAEIEAGGFHFDRALEDIHMNIEARLAALIGPAAGRLHTARSRNDQVATDLRLWLRARLNQADEACCALQAALIDRAEEHAATVMPGFTHLQVAQPVSLGHHLLAYVEMIGRDRGRLADCRKRLNESPLGAAALAGTSFPIDRAMTAELLEFDRPAANSIDAVSDRDFVVEALAAAALIAMHLSRFAEELVLWSSAQFGFIALSDRFSTGSSIMPQKRNPDAAELVRGKSGRIVGALIGLLTMMKGLALTYSKDMQEDKEPLFDAFDSLALCLAATTGMVRDMTVSADAMARAAGTGHATATDLADWLVQEAGVPFREAHAITGRIVRLADESGCDLKDLALVDLQAVEPRITADVVALLDPATAIARRTSEGGTAPSEVAKQIARARQRFL